MVNLTKGQKVNLRKEAPGLKRVLVGLGWDPFKGLFALLQQQGIAVEVV